MDTLINTNAAEIDHDFYDIEDANCKLPDFIYAMLRVSQLLTAKEAERRGVTLKQLARFMVRNSGKLHGRTLTARSIRNKLYGCGAELRGGGVKVEWYEHAERDGRKQAQYLFNFSRIYRPEDYVVPGTVTFDES